MKRVPFGVPVFRWRGVAVFSRGVAVFPRGAAGFCTRAAGFGAGDVGAEFFAQGAGRKRVLTQPGKTHPPGKTPPMRRTNKNRGFGHAEKMKKDIDKENYLC